MLTSSSENAEPVLAELERLRGSGDADAARAARWNYALLLAQLPLPLSAAQAFRAIVDDHEPGWSEEAGARAELLSEYRRAFHDTWQRARQAGESLVDAGAPVAGELLQARPGVLRAYFFDAVRTAPSRDRVLALDAMAAALDRIAGRDQRTLSDYVHRVARLDFRRRARLAAAYAALLRHAPIAEPVALALTRETASLDVADIVMAAMIERGVVADHGAWFRAMAERTGDPWFAVVLARAEADAALAAGQLLDAEAILRRAEALCTPALPYQCLTIGRRLGKLYADRGARRARGGDGDPRRRLRCVLHAAARGGPRRRRSGRGAARSTARARVARRQLGRRHRPVRVNHVGRSSRAARNFAVCAGVSRKPASARRS